LSLPPLGPFQLLDFLLDFMLLVQSDRLPRLTAKGLDLLLGVR
jgi:hypothetical protein